jgi:hypothetical protein
MIFFYNIRTIDYSIQISIFIVENKMQNKLSFFFFFELLHMTHSDGK